jgi:hypothetical protein
MLAHDLIPLATMAKNYPGARGAGCSHPATWTRWILKGVIGCDGQRHRLKATRCGSRWLVRQSDVDEFFANLSGKVDLPAIRTPAQRDRDVELAIRELEKLGA